MDQSLFFQNRRQVLKTMACGFGHLAFAGLASSASARLQPRLPARAKRIIFLFMQGGPSQVDTFDYKPLLAKLDGTNRQFHDARSIANSGKVEDSPQRVYKSPWKFEQHGRSGRWVSELFPEIAKHVDDLCFIRSMMTEGIAHGPATLFLHTGATNLIRPSMGAWVNYGLGTENANVSGFVSICPSTGNGGPRNYGCAFLPPKFQGTALGHAGVPAGEVTIKNMASDLGADEERRYRLMESLHREQAGLRPNDHEAAAALESLELAWRMQEHAPDILDTSREDIRTKELYGLNNTETAGFGRQCLMARRLAEAGVRYIQVNYGDNSANPAWDQHSDLPKHAMHALATDRPVAGLLTDLKQRGLLDDTIVWWGGEFGRTPYAQQNGNGRDHNAGGFTVWLAGGGFKPGHAHGETDEFGHKAVAGHVHMHDLHATILHQLGLDHEKLTFPYNGRDFRLTDVHGNVVRDVLA